jgi:NAD(P)-dependent dehydrogenase (short-subunit alcohol dehydrogenase family)
MPWTERDAPDLSGKVAVVTGANSGIGLEAARMLAAKGTEVVMACRSAAKAEMAAGTVRAAAPNAKVRVESLDLSNLASVRSFAERMNRELARLDLLVNNAGIMAVPRALTADGFEMQLGTNHLGHFALTGLLLGKLLATDSARVVTVSSGAHHFGKMDFDDLMGERSYEKWRAYGQSKLANLLFFHELDRRFRRAGKSQKSVAAHPGYAATNLQYVGPELEGSKLGHFLMSLGNSLIAQSAFMGALPTLRAATDTSAVSGSYYGPDGFREFRGSPVLVKTSRRARNEDDARRLWEISESLTGVKYGAI